MKILVTGATGFLGGNLVQRLLSDGQNVRVLARSLAKAKPLVERGAEPVIGDITDHRALIAALQDVEIVYHLVGKLHIPGVPDAEYYRTHVDGTSILLACCEGQPGLKRLVYASTTGVLGATGDRPAGEDSPFAPTNIYELSKLKAELLVRGAIGRGLPAVIVRPGLVYGPGDLHLLGFFRTIQRGLFRPMGKRPVRLHPVYVDDLTDALVLCAQHPQAAGECYHIAGKEAVTIATLAATIATALGTTVPRGHIPLSLARVVAVFGDLLPDGLKQVAPLTHSRLDFLMSSRIYDVTKARQSLGFMAATDLPSGVARTVDWYRQMGYLPSVR